MRITKSYIAHRNWIKAHSLMANQFPDMALSAIKKAIEIEPDESKKTEYFELKKEIEKYLRRPEKG